MDTRWYTDSGSNYKPDLSRIWIYFNFFLLIDLFAERVNWVRYTTIVYSWQEKCMWQMANRLIFSVWARYLVLLHLVAVQILWLSPSLDFAKSVLIIRYILSKMVNFAILSGHVISSVYILFTRLSASFTRILYICRDSWLRCGTQKFWDSGKLREYVFLGGTQRICFDESCVTTWLVLALFITTINGIFLRFLYWLPSNGGHIEY